MKKVAFVVGLMVVAGIAFAQDIQNGTFGRLEGTDMRAKNVYVNGISVATNATLTKSSAAITATAVVTKQTCQIYDSTGVACSNAAATFAVEVVTNATVAVTVVNGDSVLTNVTITVQR